ncbi:unnamed protein product [Caenorhabditis auriculariae]|uniref:Uncharacterized protein n=1 Tax=Caenorhabditis auriculariae TaxID=2777116 RepID=A0A8S1HPN7_9PELO|nr:unnamed protein product [Caenorhabditis auriculariae]
MLTLLEWSLETPVHPISRALRSEIHSNQFTLEGQRGNGRRMEEIEQALLGIRSERSSSKSSLSDEDDETKDLSPDEAGPPGPKKLFCGDKIPKYSDFRDAGVTIPPPPPPPETTRRLRVRLSEPIAVEAKGWLEGIFKPFAEREAAYKAIPLIAEITATAPKLDGVLAGQVDLGTKIQVGENILMGLNEAMTNALNALAFGIASLDEDKAQAREYLRHVGTFLAWANSDIVLLRRYRALR